MKKTVSGYALALALMVVAVGSIAVVSVVQQAQGLFSLSSTLYYQYQARALALSGVELVRAELENKHEGSTQQYVPFLYTNRWQVFDFTQEKDGFDAQLKLYIVAENGKINLNSLFDFEKKTYIKTDTIDGLVLMQACDAAMKKAYDIDDWSKKILDIAHKRGRPFEDVTDVIDPGLFKKKQTHFFEPSDDERVVLTDLFTVVDDAGTIQPLYFSQSLKKVLAFGNQDTGNVKDRQEIITMLTQRKTAVEWAKDWKQLLAPFYKKEYTVIPDAFKKIIASPIEAPYFSVLCYATVHGITQKLCIIAHKDASTKTSSHEHYAIKRVYWI